MSFRVSREGEETVSFSAQTVKHEGKQENRAEHILFCPQVTPRTRQSPVTELFTQKLAVVAVPSLPGHAKQRGASAERERDQKAQIDMRWFGFRGLCTKGSKATATSTSKESGRVTYFVAMHHYLHYHNVELTGETGIKQKVAFELREGNVKNKCINLRWLFKLNTFLPGGLNEHTKIC